jgi:tRNA(Glu) U13 pseudouridine synthase TruD
MRTLGKAGSLCLETVLKRSFYYLFWNSLDENIFSYLAGLEIPTPAAKMELLDELVRSFYQEVLAERELKPGLFRTKVLRKVYFRSFKRRALIVPEDLRIVDQGEDELHPARKKMAISFLLPRGAYGTMLVKRISRNFWVGAFTALFFVDSSHADGIGFLAGHKVELVCR